VYDGEKNWICAPISPKYKGRTMFLKAIRYGSGMSAFDGNFRPEDIAEDGSLISMQDKGVFFTMNLGFERHDGVLEGLFSFGFAKPNENPLIVYHQLKSAVSDIGTVVRVIKDESAARTNVTVATDCGESNAEVLAYVRKAIPWHQWEILDDEDKPRVAAPLWGSFFDNLPIYLVVDKCGYGGKFKFDIRSLAFRSLQWLIDAQAIWPEKGIIAAYDDAVEAFTDIAAAINVFGNINMNFVPPAQPSP